MRFYVDNIPYSFTFMSINIFFAVQLIHYLFDIIFVLVTTSVAILHAVTVGKIFPLHMTMSCRNTKGLFAICLRINITNIDINKAILALNKRFVLTQESIIVNCPFIMNAQEKCLPSFFQESNPIRIDLTHCEIQPYIY
jgi:hypothetical protein